MSVMGGARVWIVGLDCGLNVRKRKGFLENIGLGDVAARGGPRGRGNRSRARKRQLLLRTPIAIARKGFHFLYVYTHKPLLY